MGSFIQSKPARYFLAAFKWCRVTLLLAVLLMVAALAYLKLTGLPDYLKSPLLRSLRQRGFDAQFASARLGWGPSIIIENAAFSPTLSSSGLRLSAGWTQLELNAAALLRARLQVDSFEVLQGGLSLPVSPANQAPLSLSGVNLRVTLPSANLAVLNDGAAWFRGIHVHLNGEIHDFLSMRDWKLSLPQVPAAAQTGPAPSAPRLTAWKILEKIRFSGAPELNLHFSADGRDRNTLRAELKFTADGVQTPWGQSGPLHLRAACARLLDSGHSPFLHASFSTRDVTTPWAASRELSVSTDFSRVNGTNFSANLHLDGRQVTAAWPSSSGSNWVRLAALRWDGAATLPPPTFLPDNLKGTLNAIQTESGWGSVGDASIILQARRANTRPPPDPALGPWNSLMPWTADWQAAASSILTPKLKLKRAAFQGGWRPPQLTINKLEAVMDHGDLNASGVLDAATREVQARAALHLDPRQISPLLSRPVQDWISLCDWKSPPNLGAGLRFALPPWTNRADARPEDFPDTLQLAGDYSMESGAFRGIPITSARFHFSRTNRVWNVSELRASGAGGSLALDGGWSDATGDFHFAFDSKFDPAAAFPLLTAPQKNALRQVTFTDTPHIRGDLRGNGRAPETTGFTATLATGRLIVRGERVDWLNAQLDYTNHFLRVSELSLARDGGRVKVPLAGILFGSSNLVISMTNAFSTLDPEPVRRALGEIAPPFMREIRFDTPPRVTASGSFIPGDDSGTDMHFLVQGSQFHWGLLTADSIQGAVDYRVRTAVLTNVQASLYKPGNLQGWVAFEWDRRGTRYNSEAAFNDINLNALAREWTTPSNKLEGKLDGHLALAAPYDASVTNLSGHGWLLVHDGLLWDIKLFGILSPMLDAIAPGSSHSRAREATASLLITNGVLSTDDLEIRSLVFRLRYRGTVDAKTRLNARVEASLLRDAPLFGHLLSWMLTPLDKLFEYRLTGTLQKPVAEPVYVNKLFMDMLRPFHTLKTLLPQPPSAPSTAKPPN